MISVVRHNILKEAKSIIHKILTILQLSVEKAWTVEVNATLLKSAARKLTEFCIGDRPDYMIHLSLSFNLLFNPAILFIKNQYSVVFRPSDYIPFIVDKASRNVVAHTFLSLVLHNIISICIKVPNIPQPDSVVPP